MIGPKAERSSGPDDDGVLLGDATALTAGALLTGAELNGAEPDGIELGSWLAEAPTETGGDEALEIAVLCAA